MGEEREDGTVVAGMIADGPAGQESSEDHEREDQLFPVSSAVAGMHVSIQLCTASIRNDLNRILNSISWTHNNEGQHGRSFSAAPMFQHVAYEDYNRLIRSKFGTIVMRMAVVAGDADMVRRTLVSVPSIDLNAVDAHGRTMRQWAEHYAAFDPRPARQDIIDFMRQHEERTLLADKAPWKPSTPLSYAFDIDEPRPRQPHCRMSLGGWLDLAPFGDLFFKQAVDWKTLGRC